jgi:2-methylcitrate dehydratase PrpD
VSQDPINTLVEFADAAAYDDLPPKAVDACVRLILDTFGVILAGSTAPGSGAAIELIRDWAGKAESTVLSHSLKAPCPQAAMANGIMAHARDYDDLHPSAGVHSGAAVMPAAIAVGELDPTTSGRDLILAIALGVDLACRMGRAAQTMVPGLVSFMTAPVCGAFGAALTAGKLLGLDVRGLMDTLGIVFSQAAGNHQPLVERALSKRFQSGFSAKAGVWSALLAEKGVSGPRHIVNGPYGFYRLYYNNLWEADHLTRGLGEDYEVTELALKPYPACRATHAAIDGAIQLAEEHQIPVGEIASATVRVPRATFLLVGREFALGRSPQVDAQFSIPYTVAIALTKGTVGLADLEEDAILSDQSILQLARKVQVMVDEELPGNQLTPVTVEVVMVDGRKHAASIDTARGDPSRPLGRTERLEKFRECASFARQPLSASSTERIIQDVEGLPDAETFIPLLDLLS